MRYNTSNHLHVVEHVVRSKSEKKCGKGVGATALMAQSQHKGGITLLN